VLTVFKIRMGSEKLPYSKMLSFLKEDELVEKDLYLSNGKIKDILSRINQLMEIQKPFLRPNYSLGDLANDLNMPSYQLSAFINHIMRQRFNDLINHYRINYCLNKLKQNAAEDIKVYKLSTDCGYNNRNTFISAFKKHTHLTPYEYISQIKKETPNQLR
jgi:YesN/AraC family two-component response regulator